MLRPLLAFGTLCAVAFLLAPTVQSVHEGVANLGIHRDISFHLWKWDDRPTGPPPEPICDPKNRTQEPTVLKWPARITKNETFTIEGHVLSPDEGNGTLADVSLELFLNETKAKPGEYLGGATSDGEGKFSLDVRIPHELSASHYHVVAHALKKMVGCKTYREGWSDPEMDVTARTRIVIDAPSRVVVGRATHLTGQVVDDVGAAVRNGNVTVTLAGETHRLVTDGAGAFGFDWTPTSGGNFSLNATFAATKYYSGSTAATGIVVVPEDVQVTGSLDGSLVFQRSQPRDFTGHVYLAANATPRPLRLAFDGIKVRTCDTCPASSTVTVTPDADGAFSIQLTVPSTEPGGASRMTITGGGLKNAYPYAVHVNVPVTIALDASGDGLFHKTYSAKLTLRDDAGAPVAAPVAIEGPRGWSSGTTASDGTYSVQGSAPCGVHRIRALFNGSAGYVPTLQDRQVSVCGLLAFAPAWFLDLPWWSWPALLLAVLVLWLIARRLFERYAPAFTRGPPVELRFIEPSDGAEDVVGTGDSVVALATLPQGLPEGHTLRMGSHRKMQAATLDGNEARFEIVATDLGDLPIRAEIVDAKGRVRTRRTATLHVVRYAQEIEDRYRKIAKDVVGDEADRVTPREFERWLRERAPDVEPHVARNLVGIFEEADYSPREAGRPEFLAFVRAQKGVGRRAA